MKLRKQRKLLQLKQNHDCLITTVIAETRGRKYIVYFRKINIEYHNNGYAGNVFAELNYYGVSGPNVVFHEPTPSNCPSFHKVQQYLNNFFEIN